MVGIVAVRMAEAEGAVIDGLAGAALQIVIGVDGTGGAVIIAGEAVRLVIEIVDGLERSTGAGKFIDIGAGQTGAVVIAVDGVAAVAVGLGFQVAGAIVGVAQALAAGPGFA